MKMHFQRSAAFHFWTYYEVQFLSSFLPKYCISKICLLGAIIFKLTYLIFIAILFTKE